jgi:chromosome partitioning protein
MSGPIILAVTNRKGGSGKTTTTVNLAAEWAASGRRVLVVDLDTQGHAGFGLGIDANSAEQTIHHCFRHQDANVAALIRPTNWPSLFCIPADPLFLADSADSDDQLLAGLLRRPDLPKFDVILLDTPPSLDRLLVNALAAANGLLIPLLPHSLSVEGVKQLSRLFYKAVTGANPSLSLIGLVPVMANERIAHHRSVLQGMRRQFGAERVLPAIRSDIRLASAFAKRQPVRVAAPTSRGADDYRQLAAQIATQWFDLNPTSPNPSLKEVP